MLVTVQGRCTGSGIAKECTVTSTQPSPAPQAAARPGPKLEPLAAQMRERVSAPGKFTRAKLATGLDVILHRTDALRWRLALARENEFPSTEEIEAWRGLFAVPPGAEPHRSYKRYRHPKNGRVILYQVVELT